MAIPVTLIRAKFLALKPVMDERLTRLWAGAEAEAIGAGGITLVAAATGMSRTTIRAGRDELRKGVAACDVVKVRRAGAGRPSIEKRKPEIIDALEHLLEPAARGDRESPLRWTAKSTRKLSAELERQGYSISPQKVAQLLHAGGYRLQGADRPVEGTSQAMRGQQLELLNDRVKAFHGRGAPVIAIESRKQQLAPASDPTVGFAPRPDGRAGSVPTSPLTSSEHDGADWRRDSAPVAADDGEREDLGAPGDPGAGQDASWVSAEIDHDTPAFAARAIAHWWEHMARRACDGATELLVIGDVSGNAAHARRWRAELQGFADRAGLTIAVSHFPPCTSKWARIEHRLICRVTESWCGRPVIHRETAVQWIGEARPAVGAGTLAPLDARGTPAEWNYTLHPRRDRW